MSGPEKEGKEEEEEEAARSVALRRLEIMDTPPERAYDDIVELASAICRAPMALMTLLDGDRQWLKAKVGIPFDEAPRDQSFCAHAILQDETLVVPDATSDNRFSELLAVKFPPSLRFYAGAPIRSPDGIKLGTLCVLDVTTRDLTPEQKNALEALRRVVERQLELRRANIELVKLEKQKKELTELVVHDLKNPIASILPNSHYIAKAPGLNDNAKAAASDITQATQSMLRLVLNLLDISRAEDAELVARKRPVAIEPLLNNIVAALAVRAADQDAKLSVDVQLGGDGSAAADASTSTANIDEDLIRRVLENLADNALKYAPGGKVIVRARKDAQTDSLVLEVEDTGPGIPPAQREAIFEKYARLERSPHSERSRGLGLTFCRLAVEAHGGRIWVDGVEGSERGSIFRARIPS
jgi:signal transduction histidine kinase